MKKLKARNRTEVAIKAQTVLSPTPLAALASNFPRRTVLDYSILLTRTIIQQSVCLLSPFISQLNRQGGRGLWSRMRPWKHSVGRARRRDHRRVESLDKTNLINPLPLVELRRGWFSAGSFAMRSCWRAISLTRCSASIRRNRLSACSTRSESGLTGI